MADRNILPLRLSVVIPTHNRAGTIERAIKSVLAQDVEGLEVIVVDDASTDDTEQVIKALDDRRIRYIRHATNRGAPAARNTGIAAATGKLIAFQDSDDEWMPDKLAKQLQLFDRGGSDVNVVYCGFFRQSRQSKIYIPELWVVHRKGDILQQLLKGNFVSTQTLVVRRECFEKSGLFDEQIPRYQDWELAIRLAKHYCFYLVDEPLVTVHETIGNISSDEAAGVRAMEIILDKHLFEFKQCPSVLADHFLNLGYFKCRNGEKAEGRGYFWAALKLRPWSRAAWISCTLALVRSWIYR